MCFFNKKKKNVVLIETKFHIGDTVRFRNPRNELCTGYIYEIHASQDGSVTYDVQIGGECPAIYYGYKEEQIALK